jgi:hypothetical protein
VSGVRYNRWPDSKVKRHGDILVKLVSVQGSVGCSTDEVYIQKELCINIRTLCIGWNKCCVIIMSFTVLTDCAICVEVVSIWHRMPESVVYIAMSAHHTCLNILYI